MKKFEWDETKSQNNKKKHGIDFADAICIFDSFMVRHKISVHDGEIRRKDTGTINGVIYVAIHTKRGNRRRLISVRRANRGERRYHNEQSS